jgi:hypothetical protein
MLGRLRMSIDQCEEAYLQLSEEIFTPQRANANVLGKAYDFVNADGKFFDAVARGQHQAIDTRSGFGRERKV